MATASDASKHVVEKKRRDAVEWTLFVAVLLTLGLNSWQAYRLNSTFHTSNWMTIENQVLDLDKTFIAHPALQPLFFSGEDIKPTDAEYPSAFAEAEYIADFIDSTLSIGDRTDQEAFTPEAWTNYYRHLFESSPLLCRVVLEDADVYGPRILEVAQHDCGRHMARRPIYPTSAIVAPDDHRR